MHHSTTNQQMLLLVLALVFIPFSNALTTFNIDKSIIPNLLDYGPVASVFYEFSHRKDQTNYETKLWFQVNISKKDPSKALGTIVRLDNIQEKHGENMDNVHLHLKTDLLWRDMQGWPSGISVRINGKDEIQIPQNNDKDSMQFELDNSFYNFKPIPKPSENREIPPIIHQITSNIKGEKMKVIEKSIILVQLKNQNYDHREYSMDEMPSFIEKLEGIRARKAFEKLIPGAYKADLLRLILLKHYGGNYLDSKLIPIKAYDEFIQNKQHFICKGFFLNFVQNAFMSFCPGHEFINLAIDKLIYNTEIEFYGKDFLSVTGPGMLGEIRRENFSDMSLKGLFVLRTGLFHDVLDMKPLMIFHNGEYRRVTSIGASFDYGKLWNERKIYKSININYEDKILNLQFSNYLHDY